MNEEEHHSKKLTIIDWGVALIIIFIYGYHAHESCYVFGKSEFCPIDFFMFVLLIGIGYTYLLKKNNMDPLFHKFCDWSWCDGWSLSHLVLYFVIGLFFPDRYLFFLFIGILWELYEEYATKHKQTFFGFTLITGEKDDWWYSKTSDVVMNMIGYTLGSNLINYIRK